MDLLRTTLFAIGATVTVALSSCGDPGNTDPSAGETSQQATAGEQAARGDSTAAATPAADATATGATARDVSSNPPGDECGASKVAAFASQKATAEVKARLAAAVGHDSIRWIGPDTAVTLDYSPGRLNVVIDANEVITGGKCG